MYISAGVIAVIVWLVVWLVFGHFWIGLIAGIVIAAISGGITIFNRGRSDTIRR